MKTETDKAIQSVEDTYNIHENDRSSSDEGTERIFRQRDDVIFLLKQGEKYEKMWKELYHEDGFGNADVKYVMDELEQKYFPKEIPVGKEAKK